MVRRIRQWLLYSLLGLGGCHFMLTGSLYPTWYIEELQHSVPVAVFSESGLVLQNGDCLRLPFIKRLPVRHPVFQEAIRDGVEVHADGEVFGLLRVHNLCGNDPVVYRRLRVNLSDLAGVLNPAGIDADVVSPDVIEDSTRKFSHYADATHVDGYLILHMRRLRNDIEFSTGKPQTQESVLGGPGTHDLRTGGLIL